CCRRRDSGQINKGNSSASQRPVNERFLPTLGNLENFVTYHPECNPQVESGRCDMARERLSKGAVWPRSVECDRAGLGGKGNQRVRGRRFLLAEAVTDRAGSYRTLHGLQEWILAARIENDE